MEKTRLTQLAQNWVEEATSARRYLHSHPEAKLARAGHPAVYYAGITEPWHYMPRRF